MLFGRIKCFFESRGYGYIEGFDGSEVYFHLSVVENRATRICDGAPVYFDIINTGIGLEAYAVRMA